MEYPVKICTALHAVMSRCGYVQKQGKNAFHGYKYAGEGDLLEVLRPAMVEAGLLLIPSHKTHSEIDQYGNTIVEVEYTLAHKDGDVWPEKVTVFGCGNDRNKNGVGDKGLYKALTGANKYLLFKLFQIETGDDPEKESEHDKTPAAVDAPAPANDAPAKNNPGISKAKTWARDEIHDMNGCDDGAALLAHVQGHQAHWVRLCREFPGLWVGSDGAGLRGEAVRTATIFEVRPQMDQWLKAIEAMAKESIQPAQAAQ